jgi:hypothetical protein
MLGKKYYSDNDFTIEFWFHPQISSSDRIPLVADPVNNVGVFYEKGNLLFQLNAQKAEYTLPSTNKSFYVVATYTTNSALLYVDGVLVKSNSLPNFEFTNTDLNLVSGPTPTSNDSFSINSVAIYRYALAQPQITYHYNQGLPLPAIQIADPDGGELFEFYDDDLVTLYKYVYPESKSWSDMIVTGLEYDQSLNCLQMIQTTSQASSTIVLEDYISIPTTATFDSSKIEWDGDNGISISASPDGVTYTPCVNGQQIPGFTITSFANTGQVYLRITFASTDTSRFIPRLFNLSLSFYNNQIKYSYNGNGYMSTLEGYTGVSDARITMGKETYSILSRNNRNGLRTVIDSGFELNTTDGIRTVEFFYTPTSLNDSGIIHTSATNGYAASNISWHNNGGISKTNILGFYVNGVNKTSETNVSTIFKANQLHHVVVVFAAAVSEDIRFNYSLYGSSSALYQNVTIYEDAFDSTKAIGHYNLYTQKQYQSVSDPAVITMTESGVDTHDYDWVVIQNS